MQLLIDTATRRVIAWGDSLTPPTSNAFLLMTASDALIEKVRAAGARAVLTADGTDITLLASDPTAPPPTAKRAAAITALKTVASGTGAVAQIAQNILDLNGIT